jgi:hypothetical protein
MVAVRPTNECQGGCRKFRRDCRRTAFRLAVDGRSRLCPLMALEGRKMKLLHELDPGIGSMVNSNRDRCQNSRSK